MKAIVFHQHGGPEVLKYTDVAEPVIRASEVLVRVKACALNHLDLWVRLGIHGVPIPLPHIPGSDVAGEIAQIGADVTTVRVGQKVRAESGACAGRYMRQMPSVPLRAGQSLPQLYQSGLHD